MGMADYADAVAGLVTALGLDAAASL